jgi:hypothetical protein
MFSASSATGSRAAVYAYAIAGCSSQFVNLPDSAPSSAAREETATQIAAARARRKA